MSTVLKKVGLTTTSDAHLWLRKWSTWLALASACAMGALGTYALMPERVQLLIPDWALLILGGVALVSALLVPLATSLSQPKLAQPDQPSTPS